jgi:lipopolysaccharide transport system permease protein
MSAIPTQPEALAKPRSRSGTGVLGPWSILRQNRVLIARMTRREIESRYRGSMLGMGWAVLTPLVMLGVYTLVFAGVLRARWGEESGTGDFAARLFLGLIVFQILARILGESPGLLRQHKSFVTRMVFPVEVLPLVRVASALFDACAAFAVFLALGWAMSGPPAWTVVLAPIAIVPVVLIGLGAGWLLSALGAYLPDLGPIAATVATIILFLSAVFYPIDIVPETWRWAIVWNPVAASIDTARDLAFRPASFDAGRYAMLLVFGWACAWAGLAVFRRLREGFADVV